MTNYPPLPTGSDEFAVWAQWVQSSIRRTRPINSPTVTWAVGPDGWAASASAGGGGGTSLKLYAVTQLFGAGGPVNYFGATPWDVTANAGAGGTAGTQIIIAKSISGRTPPIETIDATVIVYDQYQDNQRRATFDDGSGPLIEFHSCHPRYITYPAPMGVTLDPDQYLITVERCLGGTGVIGPDGAQINYIESQPNRYWAYNPGLNGS